MFRWPCTKRHFRALSGQHSCQIHCETSRTRVCGVISSEEKSIFIQPGGGDSEFRCVPFANRNFRTNSLPGLVIVIGGAFVGDCCCQVWWNFGSQFQRAGVVGQVDVFYFLLIGGAQKKKFPQLLEEAEGRKESGEKGGNLNRSTPCKVFHCTTLLLSVNRRRRRLLIVLILLLLLPWIKLVPRAGTASVVKPTTDSLTVESAVNAGEGPDRSNFLAITSK